MTPRTKADRLWGRLMALAEIGALPCGGVNRQALSPGEIKAWRLLIGWGAEVGMEPSTDPAGNLFLTLPGRDRTLPPLLMGSHIDTQPTGGKFDGAFGVLAALEAAQSLGSTPARDVTVVAWMNEEGSRFAPGMMGSEAFAGVRPLAEILATRDAEGTSVAEALSALHAAFPEMPRRPLGFPIAWYLEPHIEQGPLLEQHGTPIGIVTGIQGKKTWEMAVRGEEGHAGTLDMADRRDALAGFARMADAMFREVGTIDPVIKFTIGMVRMEPNAPSVVPASLIFRIDLRHPDNVVLDAAGERLEVLAGFYAPPCTVDVKRLVDAPSNGFDKDLRARIASAAKGLGEAAMPILSAAGHDARHMAPLCPAAMIFIPCRDGVSHAEHEWAEPAHVAAGAAVLAEVAAGLVLEPAS
ncbi:Zn-dependent hydrolase [Muricoccus aerilatus]|uniref:Zn-dependent hydrolase n=1 Tax=Muricoccus aerilatus TaxID=452982 RepID=UPI0005C142D9|nr:Zn-dependent hydrolase [Roseomonas aerilata]